jgi:cell division protein FtsB
MDGIRAEVLPLNRHAIISYFAYHWVFIYSLIAPFLPLQSAQVDREKFESYLEAEEARLENNLRAVDYSIDGIDTLTLITGVGRIEKVST